MSLHFKFSILRLCFAGALALLAIGVWWTVQKPGKEISGKCASAAADPTACSADRIRNAATSTAGRESSADRGTRLQEEARALFEVEPLLGLRCLSFDKPEDLEKLRQVSRSPEFRRWRAIVQETIENGEAPSRLEQNSLVYLDIGLQQHQIKLLVELSRLDGVEADPSALHDAIKLNRAFVCYDSWTTALSGARNNIIAEMRIAEIMERQDSETLSDFYNVVRENAAMQLSSVPTSWRGNLKYTLKGILENPAEYLQNCSGEANSELQHFFRDPAQMQDLEKILKGLEGRFCGDWEQSTNWEQRFQTIQDFEDTLHQSLDGRLSEDSQSHLIELFGMSESLMHDLITTAAGRQNLAVQLLVEQFRRVHGRLPVNLEEAGWEYPSETSDMVAYYKIEAGKASIGTSIAIPNKNNKANKNK
ncbi:MAG: hypothetical protein RL095_3439 [Verrucomicrobiota bacterium]|jgi:hypothetical protein